MNEDHFQVNRISYQSIDQLSKIDKAYARKDPALTPFYEVYPTDRGIPALIRRKEQQNVDRVTLHQSIKDQYSHRQISELTQSNIDRLLETNTFTICTAHQPVIFGGPLYVVYKILSAIKLAKVLGEKYPAFNFVPVYVSGDEDHDFDEISKTTIYNKPFQWEREATGSVGSLNRDGFEPVFNQLIETLGDSDHVTEMKSLIEKHFASFDRYGQAHLDFICELFDRYGLIGMRLGDAALKNIFKDIIRKDILEEQSKTIVSDTSERLQAAGFKAQAYYRPINFFYLTEGARTKIELINNEFTLGNRKVSKEELLNEIDTHPERFSPNVIMRPVFQEFILPNISYVGGGGEVAYWLQLKDLFELYKIQYPILLRRASIQWVNKSQSNKLRKYKINPDRLFEPEESLVIDFVQTTVTEEFDTKSLQTATQNIFKALERKAQSINKSLTPLVQAEMTRSIKAIENLQKRFQKEAKRNNEQDVNSLKNIKSKLFPKNGLQERTDNFIPYVVKYGDQFFEEILNAIEPFDKDFIQIVEY